MKIIITSFLLLFSVFIYSNVQAITLVTVYTDENFAPYTYMAGVKVKGLYIEILEKAFSRMGGYDVKIEAVPWKRALWYMETGEGFAVFAPYYRPLERPYISPYSVAIYEEEIVVFCREDVMNAPRKKWPENFKGLVIGRTAGFLSGGEALAKAVKEGVVFLDEYKSARENIIKMLAGRIDGYINDRQTILMGIKKVQEDEGLYPDKKLIEAAVVNTEKVFLGYSAKGKDRFPFKDDFVRKFDAVIEDMKRNGEIKSIEENYRKIRK